jgi:hypothetical protein
LSLTVRQEHALRISENRVVRRIFGPRREEVEGAWRRPHNMELHNFTLQLLLLLLSSSSSSSSSLVRSIQGG